MPSPPLTAHESDATPRGAGGARRRSSLPALVGIFGDPVAHSRSPAMHNAAFRALKLNYVYLPFAVTPAGLPGAVNAIRALGMAGVNLTIPHKERVLPYLDGLSAEARRIGAVNTVVNHRGRLIGHNTDGRGLLMALRSAWGLSMRGRVVCLMGAGGAARAVAAALMGAGVKRLIIANRHRDRARRLARAIAGRSARVRVIALSDLSLGRIAVDCDCLINATSIGLQAGDPRLISPTVVGRFPYVCDLIYRPAMTPLLRDARAAGCRTMNGLGMLVYQGALSFQLWTGRKPPIAVMKRAAEAFNTSI
ncbi:MAG: shikimate dehydrogenase [Nitrospirae bacterium]|nr:shikimate dehydrogenase [Nitrospirota bacterium]